MRRPGERNPVIGRRYGPADQIVVGVIVKLDIVPQIAEGGGSIDLGANVIALDDHAAGRRNINAIRIVAGNQVARAGIGAANGVGGRIIEVNAAVAIGERPGPGGICADVVALNYISTGGGIQGDAYVAVAGDHIAHAGDSPADGIGAGGSEINSRIAAAAPVRQRVRTSDVGANVIALNDVITGPGPGQVDAILDIAGDEISGCRRGAANPVAGGLDPDSGEVVADG